MTDKEKNNQFIENLAKPYTLSKELDSTYPTMAKDSVREKEDETDYDGKEEAGKLREDGAKQEIKIQWKKEDESKNNIEIINTTIDYYVTAISLTKDPNENNLAVSALVGLIKSALENKLLIKEDVCDILEGCGDKLKKRKHWLNAADCYKFFSPDLYADAFYKKALEYLKNINDKADKEKVNLQYHNVFIMFMTTAGECNKDTEILKKITTELVKLYDNGKFKLIPEDDTKLKALILLAQYGSNKKKTVHFCDQAVNLYEKLEYTELPKELSDLLKNLKDNKEKRKAWNKNSFFNLKIDNTFEILDNTKELIQKETSEISDKNNNSENKKIGFKKE
jgi:hypothetical protein